jgi:hypothetical protein
MQAWARHTFRLAGTAVTGALVAGLLTFATPIAIRAAGAASAPPTVTSVSPSTGYTLLPETSEPQSSVTITGANFDGATTVSFGAVAAYFTVDSSSKIVATSPAETAPDDVNVTVTTPAGTSATSPADEFSFVNPPIPTERPVVSSISTLAVAAGRAEPVAVYGSNFDYVTSVQIGSTPVEDFAQGGPGALNVTLPTEPAGTVLDLTVTGPAGTSVDTAADHITFVVPPPPPPTGGYWEVASDGGIFSFGNAVFYGSTGGTHLNAPVVGMSVTPGGDGYWLVASDGGVFTFGDAKFFGSTGAIHLNKPIVGMGVTSDGGGYWLVASDGGVFSFGDAPYFGSLGGTHLNSPIVGMGVSASQTSSDGYWLASADGSVHAFGAAPSLGSITNPLSSPVVGITGNPKNYGYWLVTTNGSVFSFGDSPNEGSTAGLPLNKPMVGLASRYDDNTDTFAYWEAASDGGIFTFGNTPFYGSTGGMRLNAPIVGIGATPQRLEPFAP